MDLRLGPNSRVRILPNPQAGLREAIGQAVDQAMGQARDHAPKAEAAAVRWVERTRPVWSWLASEWRRLGTVLALLLITGLLIHAMFGANGMVVYRQKRAELQSLQSEVGRLQKENTQFADQIKSLKSDPAAIEKEAREQLHYTRPGEVIYVAPDAPQKPSTGRARNGQ
ncbi:MAG: septum formation initiator family protein [Terriglobales bacterium]|jgi:cell division protein FtsB